MFQCKNLHHACTHRSQLYMNWVSNLGLTTDLTPHSPSNHFMVWSRISRSCNTLKKNKIRLDFFLKLSRSLVNWEPHPIYGTLCGFIDCSLVISKAFLSLIHYRNKNYYLEKFNRTNIIQAFSSSCCFLCRTA